jgi:hypothetical protein
MTWRLRADVRHVEPADRVRLHDVGRPVARRVLDGHHAAHLVGQLDRTARTAPVGEEQVGHDRDAQLGAARPAMREPLLTERPLGAIACVAPPPRSAARRDDPQLDDGAARIEHGEEGRRSVFWCGPRVACVLERTEHRPFQGQGRSRRRGSGARSRATDRRLPSPRQPSERPETKTRTRLDREHAGRMGSARRQRGRSTAHPSLRGRAAGPPALPARRSAARRRSPPRRQRVCAWPSEPPRHGSPRLRGRSKRLRRWAGR